MNQTEVTNPSLKYSNVDSVIATGLLAQRKPRVPDCKEETRIINELFSQLAQSPDGFFQKLVDTALQISQANSTGISLLDEAEKRFVWPAVAGGLQPYLGGGTPRDFGPCGTVLDRDAPVLFVHPERYFTYLMPITPPLEEVLLIPFHMEGKAVGTLWAVIHEPGRHFDAEDKRLLENLSTFAASAYQVLVREGILEAILKKKPVTPCN
jgi:GAF domain-containing protein